MDIIRTTLTASILIHDIYANSDKVLKVCSMTNKWIIKPITNYVSGCKCIVCNDLVRNGKKPKH